MSSEYRNVYFTTATILDWRHLLKEDKYKDIIIDAFRFAVKNGRVQIWAFVIMENHFHVVWFVMEPYTINYIVKNLLKFTAQRIINDFLDRNALEEISHHLVRKKDRHYQIWKRNQYTMELFHSDMIWQKINYIHKNRERKGGNDVDYKYSSAYYYTTGNKDWDFLI